MIWFVPFFLFIIAQIVQPPVVEVQQSPAMIAAAIVVVISAVVGGTVQIVAAFSQASRAREASAERKLQLTLAQAAADAAKIHAGKADLLVTTTAEIKELSNSTNSNLQKALELSAAREKALENIISQMERTKRETEIANAAAAAALLAKPPQVTLPPGPIDVTMVNTPKNPANVTDVTKNESPLPEPPA